MMPVSGFSLVGGQCFELPSVPQHSKNFRISGRRKWRINRL